MPTRQPSFSRNSVRLCRFSLPRLKSVNQLLEVRVLSLFNSEVLQSRGLIFVIQTYSQLINSNILNNCFLYDIFHTASVNDHQSWAALLQQFSQVDRAVSPMELSHIALDFIYTPSLHFRWPLGASYGACVSPRLFLSSRTLPFLRFRLFSLIHGR